MPAHRASAPSGAGAAEETGNLVIPFANCQAVRRAAHDASAPSSGHAVNHERPAGESVQIAVASDEGHGEALHGAAAWVAGAKQDFAWRQTMVLDMQQVGQVYTEEETALITQGLALFGTFAMGTGKVRSLRKSKTVRYARTKLDKKSGLLIGEVEALVCATPEEIVAYMMHFDSKIIKSERAKNLHHTVVL